MATRVTKEVREAASGLTLTICVKSSGIVGRWFCLVLRRLAAVPRSQHLQQGVFGLALPDLEPAYPCSYLLFVYLAATL